MCGSMGFGASGGLGVVVDLASGFYRVWGLLEGLRHRASHLRQSTVNTVEIDNLHSLPSVLVLPSGLD